MKQGDNLRLGHRCLHCNKLIGWAAENSEWTRFEIRRNQNPQHEHLPRIGLASRYNEIRSAFNQNPQPLPHHQQNQTFLSPTIVSSQHDMMPTAPPAQMQDFQNINMVYDRVRTGQNINMVDDDDKPPSYLEATSRY